MWDRMALVLVTSARIQREIERDRHLRTILSETPVALQMSPRGSIDILSAPEQMDSACRDSLLSRVRDLKPLGASEVALYSVELARSLRASERDKLLQTLRVLVGRRIGTGWQSTLVLDWVHRDCDVGDWDRPTLFVVSHRMSGRISYSV